MNSFEIMQLFPKGFWAAYFFIIGICIGSFLNVLILRGLKEEPFVFERSKCPKCNNQLKWYMNIPLISFIFLKGKCAFCKEKISFQYPLIEFITGILFLSAYLCFGFTLKAFFCCIIFAVFVLFSTTDILKTVIIDYHAYFLLAVGLIASVFNVFNLNFIEALIASLGGFLAFEALSRLGYLITNQRMFGFGDSLIVLAFGSIFGLKGLVIVVALSFLIQMFSAIPMLIKNALKEKNKDLALSYVLIFTLIPTMFFVKKPLILLISTIFLLYSLNNILAEIRKKKEKLKEFKSDDEQFENSPFCLLPFGPSLVLSGFIAIFYLENLKIFIHDFFF